MGAPSYVRIFPFDSVTQHGVSGSDSTQHSLRRPSKLGGGERLHRRQYWCVDFAQVPAQFRRGVFVPDIVSAEPSRVNSLPAGLHIFEGFIVQHRVLGLDVNGRSRHLRWSTLAL